MLASSFAWYTSFAASAPCPNRYAMMPDRGLHEQPGSCQLLPSSGLRSRRLSCPAKKDVATGPILKRPDENVIDLPAPPRRPESFPCPCPSNMALFRRRRSPRTTTTRAGGGLFSRGPRTATTVRTKRRSPFSRRPRPVAGAADIGGSRARLAAQTKADLAALRTSATVRLDRAPVLGLRYE
jgi:hypothetical protein